jgi:hypothetical protein
MNSMHPQGIETITAEEKLQEELLQTYEEYCQLLLEIINHLGPGAALLRSDLPVTDLSYAHKVLVSRSTNTSPYRTH